LITVKIKGISCFVAALQLVAACLLWATPACADDTEIFEAHNCEKYRFVFIVDNSGSMSPTEFFQSKSTIDAVISEVLNSDLGEVQVAVVQYGSNNSGSVHTYDISIPFTDDATVALSWQRAYGSGGNVNSSYYQDHQPASLAAMRLDDVYAPGGALDITDGTNVQFVFFTDAWRDASASWCCSSIVAESYKSIPSHVMSGFGEYNALKDGSVLPGGIKAQFTLLHVAPADVDRAAGAAIASVGGNYSDPVEANPGDPDGSQVTPRRYIEGSLESSDTDLILSLIREVIDDIKQETSFTSPALSLDQFSKLSHRNDVYFALFSPTGKPQWHGNLKKYQFLGDPPAIIDQNGNNAVSASTGSFVETAKSFWSDEVDGADVRRGGAAAELDAWNRSVTTYLGATTELKHASNAVHEDNTALTGAGFGIDDTYRTSLLQWARGIDVLDENENGNVADTRQHIGDPLHSNPVVLTYNDGSAGLESVVYFGTNEGYLHAINSSDGTEEFSYIPPALMPAVGDYYETASAIADRKNMPSGKVTLRSELNGKALTVVGSSTLDTQDTGSEWEIEQVDKYYSWNLYTIKDAATGLFLARHSNGSVHMVSTVTGASKWLVYYYSDGTHLLYNMDGSWRRLYVRNDGSLSTSSGSSTPYRWRQEDIPRPKSPFNIAANKPYGLDGNLSVWFEDKNHDNVIESGNGESAYLYSGMRRGGRDYIALDVSSKSNPKYMWTITGGSGDFAELGQTWSKPTLTRVWLAGQSRTVLVFGGGYDTNQDNVSVRTEDSMGRGLFIVDAETGDLLWRGGADADASKVFVDMKYSIPADPALLDHDGDGYTDQIYIGDMGGQIWRFDIDASALSIASSVSGGVIADLAGPEPQNNRRIYSRIDAVLVSLEGQEYLYLSVGTGFRAHPLDRTISDRFYVLRQANYAEIPVGYGFVDMSLSSPSFQPMTEADLFDTTDNLILEGDAAEIAQASQALSDMQGWYLRLEENGEKSLSPALTVDYQVLFTTYIPIEPQQACSASIGQARLYALNLLNGAPVADLDYDNSGVVEDARDRYKTLLRPGIPTEPYAYFPEDEAPRILVGPEEVPAIKFGKLLQRMYWSEIPTF
jgi:hypothetical protein